MEDCSQHGLQGGGVPSDMINAVYQAPIQGEPARRGRLPGWESMFLDEHARGAEVMSLRLRVWGPPHTNGMGDSRFF